MQTGTPGQHKSARHAEGRTPSLVDLPPMCERGKNGASASLQPRAAGRTPWSPNNTNTGKFGILKPSRGSKPGTTQLGPLTVRRQAEMGAKLTASKLQKPLAIPCPRLSKQYPVGDPRVDPPSRTPDPAKTHGPKLDRNPSQEPTMTSGVLSGGHFRLQGLLVSTGTCSGGLEDGHVPTFWLLL